jgi:hypothetical protein
VHTPPQITTQPVSQAVFQGTAVTFSVTATGIPSPSYQWYHGTSAISAAVNASYSISSAQTSDAGDYYCNVYNGVGSGVNSNTATLTVTVPTAPVFTLQPVSQTVTVGSPVSFSVAASGNPAPSYQWYRNGGAIVGATSATYSMAAVLAGDAGNYYCVASNGVLPNATSNTAVLTVNVPPQITTQPVSQAVAAGSSVTFTVAADGIPAPAFQWLFNGGAIGGATGASYTIASVQASNAGIYRCIASNGVGIPDTSDPATLTVSVPAAFTSHPQPQTVLAGGSVTFSATATGTPAPSYRWYHNGGPITGATGSSLTFIVTASDSGDYLCKAWNGVGDTATSNSAKLTVHVLPQFTLQPQSQTVGAGAAASFTVAATGNPPPTYQWYHNAAAIPSAANATYTISAVSINDSGSYYCVADNGLPATAQSNSAKLTVLVPPQIVVQPISQTVQEFTSVTFTVQASGNPAPSYQWYHNGAQVSGGQAATLSIASVLQANAGSYYCVASNGVGTPAQSSTGTLTVTYAPASIVTHPQNVGVNEGGTATFTVVAAGSPVLTYQWKKDGAAISGANLSTLTITNASYANEGNYSCVVDNPATQPVESNPALLVINPAPPQITKEPVSRTLSAGQAVTFAVEATGSNPLTFTWYKNDVELVSGQGLSSYTINSVAQSDSGAYYVVVKNIDPTPATSLRAVLTVLAAGQVVNSNKLAISGELYDASGNPVGPDPQNPVMVDADVRLYASVTGGTPVYAEAFLGVDGKAVAVLAGLFSLRLGEGVTRYDLATVLENNPHLFAEITVTVGGQPDTLAPRTPITASPFTLK